MSDRHGQSASQVIPLRERQRLIMTYDAGETPCSPEQAERQIRSLVQCFEGSHIGILQRCLGVIRAFQKSDVLEMWPTQGAWVEAGMDPMAVFVDECHRCGIHAWGSRRMNDAHHTYRVLEFDRYQTKFYTAHPKLRLKSQRDAQVSPTYDWNKPAVAAQNLAFLREVAENYDVDGLDLDYTRIGPYFNTGEEAQGRQTMNQHVRDVRNMLDEVGRKKGKYLGLSAQLYAQDSLWKRKSLQLRPEAGQKQAHESPKDDVHRHFDDGLDVRAWVREGLLDFLIAHCRTTSLYEMALCAWRRAVEGTNCRLVAGAGKPGFFKFRREGSINGYPAHLTQHLEHRAIAHRLYEQGAWGIFFYDYVVRSFELQWQVYRELGDPERLRYANKAYVYQMVLPLALGYRSEGGKAEMEIDIPDDLAAARVAGYPVRARLLLNITELVTPDDIGLEVNGHPVTVGPEQSIETPLSITDHPTDELSCHLEAAIALEQLKKGRNTLTFTLKPAATKPPGVLPQSSEVRKVNLEIVYRDETYPYWLALQLDRTL
jgi:hypothetical protein